MRQQYYVHNDVLHNFACAIIYNAYQDYERTKRGLKRYFKQRHIQHLKPHIKWKFDDYMSEYRTLKKFFQGNIWFDYLDINPEYFKRLMEDSDEH